MARAQTMYFVVVLVTLWGLAPKSSYAQRVVVIVNTANVTVKLSDRDVSDIFLKKRTVWTNKKTIVPVDQEKRSQVRNIFTKHMHGRSISNITTYWQTQIFSGKQVPPIIKSGDADVIAFVRSNANAIGYISADTPMEHNVKVVAVAGE